MAAGAYCDQVDVEGSTAVLFAIKGDHPECVIYLLDNGANLDGITCDNDARQIYGMCPLFMVIKDDNIIMLRILLRHNCNLTILGSLKSSAELIGPLEYCLLQGHVTAAKMLLAAGVNPWQDGIAVTFLLEENSDTCLWIKQEMHRPPSLIQSCRLTIRKVLGWRVSWALHTLPLPTRLIDFLNLGELDHY